MSFLTPLYLLGALAVGLPILFHLIRRTPRGRQVFSSLMFLEPSPPRVTRRSRIEDWLLLCLRGLAICLLAAAFARPFLRQPVAAEIDNAQGRWIALLIDTSASMRREGLWDEARQQVTELLEGALPGDRVAVYTFDAAPEQRFGWEAWTQLEAGERAAAAGATLADVQPGWRETNLGSALVVAADSLQDAAGQDAGPGLLEIVVVSDFQAGSRLEALQGYAWPEDVAVRVMRVGSDIPATNAAVHAVTAAIDDAAVQRVRVTNAGNSERETFRLAWLDEFSSGGDSSAGANEVADAPSAEAGLEVYVAPGQSRVLRAPDRPDDAHASRLVLLGDDQPFDNTCYITATAAHDVTIVVLSSDDPADPALQRYYLEPMFPDTADRNVHVVDWEFESSTLPDSEHGIQMVLLLEAPRADQIASLRKYLEGGGLVWQVLGSTTEGATALFELAGVPAGTIEEADVSDYAMLTDVDFSHPILAPFADPRFSDFTSLRFWKHRRIDEGALPAARILARFDDGDPALGELQIGDGHLIFTASGWTRADSQLALWSKFVPLANSLLEYGGGLVQTGRQYIVGEPIDLHELTSRPEDYTQWRRPDGSIAALPVGSAVLEEATEPGVYALLAADGNADRTVRFAVNLAPAESRTEPLSTDALEAMDVRLAASSSPSVEQANADRERQLQNRELEQQQKLWRWLLIAAVAVLLIETVLAGRLAGLRRSQPVDSAG